MVIVDYKTFTKHLLNSQISDVTIYNFTSEIEVTYLREGVEYGSKGPYGPYNDDLLHAVLDNQNVEYKILEADFNDGNILTSGNFGMISGLLFMAIPFLMTVIIFIQVRTIRKLADKISSPQKE